MVRQCFGGIAILLILAVTIEILTGSVAEAVPRKRGQTEWRQQNYWRSNMRPSARIAGGDLATINKFPYQVAIYYRGEFTCAGSYLGGVSVLSTANCFVFVNGTSRDKSLFHLIFRSSKVLIPEDDSIVRRVKEVIVHPDFDKKGRRSNNIAILTMNLPVTVPFARLERGAELTQKDYFGQKAVTLGWGSTFVFNVDDKDGEIQLSSQLKRLEVTIMTAKKCNEKFQLQFPTETRDFTEGGKMLCATLNKQGTCRNDYGGPLLVNGIQVGVNNLSYGCGDGRYPMLFLRVAAYRDWINKNVQGLKPRQGFESS